MKVIRSKSERETKKVAIGLVKKLKQPLFVCLQGQLGSGKTVFVKGFASALGLKEKDIKSPTYTYVRQYKLPSGKACLYHFDFYRIEELDDLMAFELNELFQDRRNYFIIEWPERISAILPADAVNIKLEYLTSNQRKIILP